MNNRNRISFSQLPGLNRKELGHLVRNMQNAANQPPVLEIPTWVWTLFVIVVIVASVLLAR